MNFREDLDLERAGRVAKCEDEVLAYNNLNMATPNEKRIQNKTDVPFMNDTSTNKHLFLCYSFYKNCCCFFRWFRGKM